MYTCKKFLKKDGRKVRKAAKNEILILKMYVFRAVYLDVTHFSEERCLQMVLSAEICLKRMQMILFMQIVMISFQFLACFLSQCHSFSLSLPAG